MSSDQIILLATMKRNLSFLMLGQKGGKNRMQIISLLRDRPYNINQMANKLGLNYRTVKHHIEILLKYQLISSSRTGGYGDVFFLSPDLEGNMHMYDSIVQKMDTVKQLSDFTDSAQFFKKVLQQTYDGVIIVDLEWDIVFWNKSSSRIFGRNNAEVLHGPVCIFFDEDRFSDLMKKVNMEKRVHDFEITGFNGSGDSIDINLTIDIIRDAKNAIIGYSIMARDVTESNSTRKKLDMKRKTLEVIMENTGTGIAYLDTDFNFLNVNTAFAAETGHSKKDLIGKNYFSVLPSDENQKIFEKVRSSDERIEVFDKPYEFPDQPSRGITYWTWALVPVKDSKGDLLSLVLTIKNTTERVRNCK